MESAGAADKSAKIRIHDHHLGSAPFAIFVTETGVRFSLAQTPNNAQIDRTRKSVA